MRKMFNLKFYAYEKDRSASGKKSKDRKYYYLLIKN